MKDSTNLGNILLAIIHFWKKWRHIYVICDVMAFQNILDRKNNKIKSSVSWSCKLVYNNETFFNH